MSRYIDLEVLERRIKENVPIYGGGNTPYEVDLLEWCRDECIRQGYAMPTADVVEVRHGYWKDRYGDKYANKHYECSICGGAALYGFKNNGLGNQEIIQVLSDFCPRCGAKMDGERR